MEYTKPNKFYYRITQFASKIVSKFFFKRKFIRNEIKGKKGAYVVVANHQAALDFVNLIGATRRRLSFVISNSFYNSLPAVKGIMDKVGVIPKQQFQTTLKDIGRMKAVVENDSPLVIYPAGLMSEDGRSTPIPVSTYKFLKWLGADIYVARTSGSYFCTPKWSRVRRPGRTYIDIYKLFGKEELHDIDEETVKEKTEEALLFDAYREQEKNLVKYKHGDNLEGLQNVLYSCPNCKTEYRMQIRRKKTICCEACGYAETADKYGFLHKTGEVGEEIRYVSDWSQLIFQDLKGKIERGEISTLTDKARFSMIDPECGKFKEVGEGTVTLTPDSFEIKANINGAERELLIPTATFASLPFSPGRYFEIQHGEEIFRCSPARGALVMKFINMVKIYYELHSKVHEESHNFH